MNRTVTLLVVTGVLALSGCGGGSVASDEGGVAMAGNDAVAIAVTGSSDATDEAQEEEIAQADMNARIMEAVASKVEEELNAELAAAQESGELTEEDIEASPEKAVGVGLSLKGLTVNIVDERIPFAGGRMVLNGQLGVKLKLRGFGQIALETNGNLISKLEGVQRTGTIREIPYSLALNGTSTMEVRGAFVATVQFWKVKSLAAEFRSAIVDSDVVATGTVGTEGATGSVEMADVAIELTNADILHQPKAFTTECSGRIETRLNDNMVAGCTIDASCRACR